MRQNKYLDQRFTRFAKKTKHVVAHFCRLDLLRHQLNLVARDTAHQSTDVIHNSFEDLSSDIQLRVCYKCQQDLPVGSVHQPGGEPVLSMTRVGHADVGENILDRGRG